MSSIRLTALEQALRERGTATASELVRALGVSQPTLSRLISSLGSRVVRMGRARATRYGLSRDVARAGHRWPLYHIDPEGHAHPLGHLHALHDDAFHFVPTRALPALLHGDFADGLFPGLPWFLDDQRPQGFIGRAFARRVAGDIGASDDLAAWRTDDVLLALLRHGHDNPGELVLGEGALQAAQRRIAAPEAAVPSAERQTRYPILANAAIAGEDIGSSAGGEQPKFAVTLREGEAWRPVIVKFSDRTDTPGARRWADLLVCEHLASQALRQAGLDAAHNALLEADGRVFLESTRFDRTPALGRRGLVSLAALDAGFYGHGRIAWSRFAPQLERDGWLSPEDARHLRLAGWFGELIANTDMHLGNASLLLADTRPLLLAPIYDMLPMRFRPASNGEVVTRLYTAPIPLPEERDDWTAIAPAALGFWQRVADDARISPTMRELASTAVAALKRMGG
jgi:hypothetical protein